MKKSKFSFKVTYEKFLLEIFQCPKVPIVQLDQAEKKSQVLKNEDVEIKRERQIIKVMQLYSIKIQNTKTPKWWLGRMIVYINTPQGQAIIIII